MGENDSPGRLFQNGILLGLLRHYGFLFELWIQFTKWIKWEDFNYLDKAFAYGSSIVIHLGQDWTFRACLWLLLFLSSFFPF